MKLLSQLQTHVQVSIFPLCADLWCMSTRAALARGKEVTAYTAFALLYPNYSDRPILFLPSYLPCLYYCARAVASTHLEDAVVALEVLRQLEAHVEVAHLVRDVVVSRVGSRHLQNVPAASNKRAISTRHTTQYRQRYKHISWRFPISTSGLIQYLHIDGC